MTLSLEVNGAPFERKNGTVGLGAVGEGGEEGVLLQREYCSLSLTHSSRAVPPTPTTRNLYFKKIE